MTIVIAMLIILKHRVHRVIMMMVMRHSQNMITSEPCLLILEILVA